MLTYHRYVEACKFGNGLKRLIKDPKFSSHKVPRTQIVGTVRNDLLKSQLERFRHHIWKYGRVIVSIYVIVVIVGYVFESIYGNVVSQLLFLSIYVQVGVSLCP